MHEAYEAAAAEAGWETQARSRVPWQDVPEANKVAMRAAYAAALRHAADVLTPICPYREREDHPTDCNWTPYRWIRPDDLRRLADEATP